MSPPPWNLFAIMDERSSPIRRIPLTQPLQTEIRRVFESQRADLFAEDPEEIEFEPGFRPEQGQLVYIPDFLPQIAISDALRNPLAALPIVVNENQLEKIKGLFTGDRSSRLVLFQVFDRRRLLTTGRFTIMYSRGTFQRLQTLGLTLDTQLAAALVDGRLIFRSFAAAHRILDLTAEFHEATDQEVVAFGQHSAIQAADPELLMQHADSWVRRKLTLIRTSGVLETPGLRERLAASASKYAVAIRFDSTGKLVVPAEKKAFKDIVRLLEEDFYTSEITSTQFVSNSKRRLGRGGAPRPR
jgi:Domain of unknown function (DUF4868)